MYKLFKFNGEIAGVTKQEGNLQTVFGFNSPANTDYRNFKKAINEETAELQDADGNTMTAAEAKAFIATLP